MFRLRYVSANFNNPSLLRFIVSIPSERSSSVPVASSTNSKECCSLFFSVSASDEIGATEFMISCVITRNSFCHAFRFIQSFVYILKRNELISMAAGLKSGCRYKDLQYVPVDMNVTDEAVARL